MSWSKDELADTVIPINPFKGKTFGEVTLAYLRWCRTHKAFHTRELQSRLKAWLELPEHRPIKKRRPPFWRSRASKMMRGL